MRITLVIEDFPSAKENLPSRKKISPDVKKIQIKWRIYKETLVKYQ
jgi:hypothetical protein